MPNFLDYQRSIAKEFEAYENRVRNLIDDAHWGEEGRYKEIILINYLKRVLPKNISVGTGFVRNKDKITSQIDIIIYDNMFPLLFSEGDFVIATPENVIGIIEVKTRIRPAEICKIIDNSNNNADIITEGRDKMIFNGIFSYNSSDNPNNCIDQLEGYDYSRLLERCQNEVHSYVNHIALGKGYFVKLWPIGQSDEVVNTPYYSVYKMKDGLAISYFLSNLQESVIRKAKGYLVTALPAELHSFFYPLPQGKEANLIKQISWLAGLETTV